MRHAGGMIDDAITSPASMSLGPLVRMLAATWASTKTLLPVPTTRLIVRLPVFAVKTYLPTRVDQQSAEACIAAATATNARCGKRASVLSAQA